VLPAAAAGQSHSLAAPPTLATAAPPAEVPKPIYWKQDQFLIPYQLPTGGEFGARSVWLLVSKDRGATWHKISEARPSVKAFNYRADGDGEYWFALRTIDASARPWPTGGYQPELCVVVDRTQPRIEMLRGAFGGDGALLVAWQAIDETLDAASLTIEVQTADGQWQPIPLPHAPASARTSAGQTAWPLPEGARPIALRAVVNDRAGNSGAASAAVTAMTAGPGETWYASMPAGPGNPPTFAQSIGSAASNSSGWVAASNNSVNLHVSEPFHNAAVLGLPPAGFPSVAPPAVSEPNSAASVAALGDGYAAQTWPASAVDRRPFRLFSEGANLPSDGVTRYGRPAGVDAPLAIGAGRTSEDEALPWPEFQPLEPFRQASLRRLPPVEAETSRREIPDGFAQTDGEVGRIPADAAAKHVSSRTFALDYELVDEGGRGIARVELWGTRDSGQTWRRFAEDRDFRSPFSVTVDEAGLYGFRILVEPAGGLPVTPPQSGDAPELWVRVDLQTPRAELTAIERGAGNLADHLLIRWQAEDDNLGPRPVSLFYGSRPAGPWSAIATNLENTGRYLWRVERHVPTRCFLRLEVRDAANNRTAYQTIDPIVLEVREPIARIRSVE
jgi:hypothetical protein